MGWQRRDAVVTSPISSSIFRGRFCEDRGYPALAAAPSAQSMWFFRRMALRLWRSLARRLFLLHLFLLSGMLLFDLLRLLSVALFHLLFLCVVVVLRGGLLMFFFLLLLQLLVILRLLRS